MTTHNRSVLLSVLSATVLWLAGCSADSRPPPAERATPAGTSSYHLAGPQASDLGGSKQGQAIAFVDLDGDGLEDKVVGAPFATTPSTIGAVLVYRATPNGYAGAPTFLLTGEDNLGASLVDLGDVDGDGKSDLAAGAFNGASLSGAVVIYAGGGKGKVIAKVSGDQPLSKLGLAIAAGDLDGDGRADLLVGAPYYTSTPARYQAGAVRVYFAPGFTTKLALEASSTATGLGWSLASGDLNGDTIADLCLSASGKVLCYYGGSGFSPSIDVPDLTVASKAAGFGKALAICSDLDGDGFGELLIGAPNANGNAGSLHIVRGGIGKRTFSVDSPSQDLLARIDGAASFNRFGSAVTTVETGGAAKPAIAVGAPMADASPYSLGGRVYLFHGADIDSTITLAKASIFNAAGASHGYGTTLAAGQHGKLLVGSPRADADTGRVDIIEVAAGEQMSGGSGGDGGQSDPCE